MLGDFLRKARHFLPSRAKVSQSQSQSLRSCTFTSAKSETQPEEESESKRRRKTDDAYLKSPWLSPWVLGVLVAIFITSTTALLALWVTSKKQNGFRLVTSNHYYYTFGPTAVLVTVVALWRQVDYHSKATAPWTNLSKHQQTASHNILLDYVSPIQLTSLAKAVKEKELAVVYSISGFVILKLITLVSTGLFVVTPSLLPQPNVPLTRTTRFDGSLYNETTFPTLNDSSLVYTAFGLLTKGLAFQEGTQPDLAYESFRPPAGYSFHNRTIVSTVQALVPVFECESAPSAIVLQPANTTDPHPSDEIILQFPECQLLGGGRGTSIYALNPQTFTCPPRQLSPLMQRIECDIEGVTNATDNWQLLTLADLRYEQTLPTTLVDSPLGSSVQASEWSTTLQQLTGIACKSSYSIEQVNLTYDFSISPPNVSIARPPRNGSDARLLEGFTPFDLGRLFTASLSAASGMFGNVLDGSYAEEYPNTMFKFMSQLAGGSYESLLNETYMIEAAEKVFQQVAVQIVQRNLLRDDDSFLLGDMLGSEERLEMNIFSLWAMVVGFTLMIIITVLLILVKAPDVNVRKPDTMFAVAMLLRRSSGFHNLMKSNVGAAEKSLEAILENRTYHISGINDKGHPESLKITVSEPIAESAINKEATVMLWWTPLVTRRVFLAATLGLPPVFVALLEGLQVLSNRHQGITTISDADSFWSKSLTRFIPALVVLLIATMFNAMDFTIALLAPFTALKVGNRSADATVLSSIVGSFPTTAAWTSLKYRYWGALFSLLAALIGSILTIVSSGLYTVQIQPRSSGMQLQRTDLFNAEWGNSVLNDSGAAIMTSLTESSDLPYPRFTYEELAFPSLKATSDQLYATESPDSINLIIPAWRASLNCTFALPEQFNVTTSYSSRIGAGVTVRASMPLPENCIRGGPDGNLTNIDFVQSFQIPSMANTSFIGKMLDIHVGPFDSVRESSSGELSPSTQNDNPSGCPSLAFIYGYVDVNDVSLTTVTASMCYQFIEEVGVNTTLSLPDLIVESNSVPRVDESSIRSLTNGSDSDSAFTYRLQVHIDTELSIFNQTEYDSTDTGSPPVDKFFQGVIFGRHPLEQIMLARSDQKPKVEVAIQSFYRRYMAQAISANMRVPSLAADAETIQGTATFKDGELRVVQNETAKIILQALLGTMFVLGGLAIWCSTLREILPYNPCTVAGVAALWAGSKFCTVDAAHEYGSAPEARPNYNLVAGEDTPEIPDRAEFMRPRQLRDAAVLNGWCFRLGWWESKDGGKRYGIDAERKQRHWGNC